MNLFKDDGQIGPNLISEGYQKGKSAVFDHLVPINERSEDVNAFSLQGEPNLLNFAKDANGNVRR